MHSKEISEMNQKEQSSDLSIRDVSNRNYATTSKHLKILQRLRTSYLSFAISVASLLIAVINVLKQIGLPLEKVPAVATTPMFRLLLIVLLGCIGIFLISLRSPRILVALLRLIFGPPTIPSDLPRLFHGPRPYSSQDSKRFHGRQADIDECWSRIQTGTFFILEGESGSGKSSILNTALIPMACDLFHVIECRVAEDPFGRLFCALKQKPYYELEETVNTASLSKAITEASYAIANETPNSAQPTKALILCFDQFEELFVTVQRDIQKRFLTMLRRSIEAGKCRLVIAIRSDFIDLLIKTCYEIDPEQKIFNLGNYYVLRAFQKEQAQSVLGNILEPITGNDALITQQIENFIVALVRELLRPPSDKRLYQGDKKTVLPVELQTVGLVMESLGASNFSVANLKRLGGKAGLFRAYIEDAKTYVWRKTGVPGDQSLLILKQLISPSKTKWAQTPELIGKELNISTGRVNAVLNAFSEKYLVNQLLAETAVGSNGNKYKYELMHEHLAQILTEAPDPILQRARDAEEQLNFFAEKAKASFLLGEKRRFFRARIRSLFAQPISLFNVLRFWRFAHSSDSRWVLRYSLRGFSFRLLALLLPPLLTLSLWFLWTRSDAYQIRRVLNDAPVAQAASARSSTSLLDTFDQNASESLVEWAKALIKSNRVAAAFNALQQIKDDRARSEALITISNTLSSSGKMDESRKALNEALTATRQIIDNYSRSKSLIAMAHILRQVGRTDEANIILDEALDAARQIKRPEHSAALLEITEAIIQAGRLNNANNILSELLANTRKIGTEVEEERIPNLVQLANLLIKLGRKVEAKSVLAKALDGAHKMEDDIDRTKVAAGVAEAAAKLEEIEMCLNAARLIKEDYALVDGLVIVIKALTSTGKFEAALSAASLTLTEHDRARAYSDIAEAMVLAGKSGSALTTVRQIKDEQDRCQALIIVGEALIDTRMTDEANKVFEEAFLAARQIKYDIDRANRLMSLADALDKAGNTEQSSRVLDEAVAAARHVSDDLVQAEADFSAQRAEIKSERAKLNRKLSHRNRLPDDDNPAPPGFDNDLSNSIFYLTQSLSKSGRADDALPIARKIQDYKSRAYALIAIAESFQQTQRIEEAKKILDEALSSANQIQDDALRSLAFLSVAETQIEVGETDRAGRTLDKALLAINHATDDRDYFQIISSIAQNMAKAGRVDAALNAIQSIKNDTTRYYDLRNLIEELIKIGKIDEKKNALIKSLEIARQIRNDNSRSHLIATIAKELARLREFRLARLTSDSCSSVDKLGVYAVILSEYEDSKHLGSAVSPSAPNR